MSVKNWKLNRMSCRSRVACDIHMSWVLDEFLSFQSNEDVFDYLTSFCAKKNHFQETREFPRIRVVEVQIL